MLNELVLPILHSEILALQWKWQLTLILSIQEPPKDFDNDIDFILAENICQNLSLDDTSTLSSMKWDIFDRVVFMIFFIIRTY